MKGKLFVVSGVTVDGKISVDVMAKSIVSDAGIANTFTKLLPQTVAQKSCEYRI